MGVLVVGPAGVRVNVIVDPSAFDCGAGCNTADQLLSGALPG